MSIEIEQSKITKAEAIELLSKFTKIRMGTVATVIELLIKIGVISEYVFVEEPKPPREYKKEGEK